MRRPTLSLAAWISPLALVLGSCATILSHGGDAQHVPAPVIAIVGGNIVDPTSAERAVPGVVLVSGERIVAAGPKVGVPAGARRIDARGKYVVPGLWDMHAHLAAPGPVGRAPERYVGHGVLAVRDMGGLADQLFALRAELRSGVRVGPTLLLAGPTLNGESFAVWHRPVPTVEEARRVVRELKSAQVDFIKIHRAITPEVFQAIASETKALGLRFSGHVPSVMNFGDAADAGMHTVEHVQTLPENEIRDPKNPAKTVDEAVARIEGARGDEVFAALARNRTYFTPTMVAYIAGAEDSSPERAAGIRRLYERFKTIVDRAHKAGVPILAGTDVLTDQGEMLHRELEALVQSGLSPREALASATTLPAEAMGRGPGQVVAGLEASFLVVDADPTLDVRNLRKVSLLLLRGRVIDAGELAELRAMQDRPPL